VNAHLQSRDFQDSFPSFRESAQDYFTKSGFPTSKTEAWRFTNISPILKTKFEYHHHHEENKDQIPAPSYADKCLKIDILNGRVAGKSLDHLSFETEGILLNIISEDITDTKTVLSSLVSSDGNPTAFTALNMALFSQVIHLHIPDNHIVSKPILLNIFSQSSENPVSSNIRIHITGGKHSQFTIIETYSGNGKTYFNNSVIDINLDSDAKLEYYKIQNESDTSYHISNTVINQGKSSIMNANILSFSGKLIRNDIQVDLNGEGAELNLFGLTLGQSQDHIDNTVLVNHRKPHCMSNQLFKNILDHKSHGVFSGLITVYEDAQKTDARQKNQNLLLSETASVNSNPQLEINADDVRCSHGSTTGQLDDEAIFYLRSRGISYEDARKMLISGFAHEIVNGIGYTPIKDSLNIFLDNYLT
jgi:Fe-S cluster assembly protein SufD